MEHIDSFRNDVASHQDRFNAALPYRWPQILSLLSRLHGALVDAAAIVEPTPNQTKTNGHTKEIHR